MTYAARRGHEWRELATLGLKVEGVQEARAKRTRRPGQPMGTLLAAEEEPLGDILDVHDWTLHTRAAKERRIPTDIAAVESDARINGTPYSAILYAGPTEGRYETGVVVLSLPTFAKLLKERP